MTELCEVQPGIFLGDKDTPTDHFLLNQHHITAILNLSGPQVEYSPPHQMPFLHLYFPDNQPIPPDILTRAIEFIETQLNAGRKILVHCTLGLSRSPAIIIAWMLHHYPRMTWDQALHEIMRKKYVMPSPVLKVSVLSFFNL
jgi:predicted protein tyrosine phosphatase